MLSCEQCRKYLAFFLDQALGVKESLDVQEHLQECPECTDLVAAERAVRAVVRRQAATAPLPQAEKTAADPARHATAQASLAAVGDVARGGAVAGRRPWRSAGHSHAAGVPEPGARPVKRGQRGAQIRARDRHGVITPIWTRTYPWEVKTSDDGQLIRWANDVIGHSLNVPCITDKAAQLVGGRLCRLRNRKGLAMEVQARGLGPAGVRFPGCRPVAPCPAHDTDRGRQVLRTARRRAPGYFVAARRRNLFNDRRRRPPSPAAGGRLRQVPACGGTPPGTLR